MPLFRRIYLFLYYFFLKSLSIFILIFFAFWGGLEVGLSASCLDALIFGGTGWWALCRFLDVFIFFGEGVGFMPLFRCIYFFWRRGGLYASF